MAIMVSSDLTDSWIWERLSHRSGMFSLLKLIHSPSRYSNQAVLDSLSLEELVLVEWHGSFTPQRILAGR